FTVKLTHVETTEDLKLAEAILQKFDHTPEALELQPSLAYSLVRNYFDFAQKQRVLTILHDKINRYSKNKFIHEL
ncbi:unnamed protein product, partial [Rotaria sp. Silwood2]